MRSGRAQRPERVQWPHCHHPLTQPKPAPPMAHGRITPPSLWEPAGTAKRDPPRHQVQPFPRTMQDADDRMQARKALQ